MKKNSVKNSFGKFASQQLSSKQFSQIKGGSGDASCLDIDQTAGIVVVDVISL